MMLPIVRVLLSLCIVSSVASLKFSTHNLANCVESGHQRFINIRENIMAGLCEFVCLILLMAVTVNKGEDIFPKSKFVQAKNRMLCTKAQGGIDFKELMGLWNVIQVIEHSERYTDRRNYLRTVSLTHSCPVVHFSTDDDREVRLLWNEENGYIQYSFRMTNINNPGFWMSLGFQTGTMIDNNYEHFSGTVQVMKAVQSHMVLTFCSPNERHFSVILSRTKHLSHDEIRGVHKQLQRVNLPLIAIQGYCNGGLISLPSTSLMFVALMTIFSAASRIL